MKLRFFYLHHLDMFKNLLGPKKKERNSKKKINQMLSMNNNVRELINFDTVFSPQSVRNTYTNITLVLYLTIRI